MDARNRMIRGHMAKRVVAMLISEMYVDGDRNG